MELGVQEGLLAGVYEVVDCALGVQKYATKSAAQKINKKFKNDGISPSTSTLVQVVFDRLDRNWKLALKTARPSIGKNFRWREPQPGYHPDNPSREVTLERELIKALTHSGDTKWSNQVPLISGIAGHAKPHAGKRMAVDLVRQTRRGFEFVELKINNGTPIFAAIEILLYGLLWLLSRRDRNRLGYVDNPILEARELCLSVLAPRDYYCEYTDLITPLTCAINEGLNTLGRQQAVKMAFRFSAFPESFSRLADRAGRPTGDDLIALLDKRETCR